MLPQVHARQPWYHILILLHLCSCLIFNTIDNGILFERMRQLPKIEGVALRVVSILPDWEDAICKRLQIS